MDHTTIGGRGSAVAEVLAEAGSGARLQRLGIPDRYAPIGYAPELYAHFGLDAEVIAKALLRGHAPRRPRSAVAGPSTLSRIDSVNMRITVAILECPGSSLDTRASRAGSGQTVTMLDSELPDYPLIVGTDDVVFDLHVHLDGDDDVVTQVDRVGRGIPSTSAQAPPVEQPGRLGLADRPGLNPGPRAQDARGGVCAAAAPAQGSGDHRQPVMSIMDVLAVGLEREGDGGAVEARVGDEVWRLGRTPRARGGVIPNIDTLLANSLLRLTSREGGRLGPWEIVDLQRLSHAFLLGRFR